MLFWMARFHILPKMNKKFELHFQVGGHRAAGKANMKKFREKGQCAYSASLKSLPATQMLCSSPWDFHVRMNANSDIPLGPSDDEESNSLMCVLCVIRQTILTR